jgi:mannose-6-phosphate isomerase-like protein (cupin superfamily)
MQSVFSAASRRTISTERVAEGWCQRRPSISRWLPPPATVSELYRTAAPLPELKPGSYEFNLTRVTFPPGMPSDPPHHRSGAALYYILAGIGANTVDGKTAERRPGSLYEPFGLVHQWGNPGSEPLTFLAFNINPEGVPAVVLETPTRP